MISNGQADDLPPPTAAERRKARQRLVLIDAALDLFEAKGFDATTVDEIAGAGDVSPRTFFRYFESKNDVVMGEITRGVAQIGDLVASRPQGEPAPIAICEAGIELLADLAASERYVRCLQQLMSSPALQVNSMAGLPMVVALRSGLLEREPERSEEEAAVLATLGAALMRRSIEYLLTTQDIVGVEDFTRQSFAVSRAVWSEA